MSYLNRSSHSRFFFDPFGASRAESPGLASSFRTAGADTELEQNGERNPLLSSRSRYETSRNRKFGLTFDLDTEGELPDHHGRPKSSIYTHHGNGNANLRNPSNDFVTYTGSERNQYNETGIEAQGDDEAAADVETAMENASLLPIFSAQQLDSIPTYQLTHSIRLLVTSRCDTTLSWDQLRSPQVSQFLLKPMQQELRHSYFTKATLYALLANALQFTREATERMAIAGSSKTRAMICEILAIKLMKEFKTKELVEALSYDFNPLQGQEDQIPASEHPAPLTSTKGLRYPINSAYSSVPGTARISCLEIAIRAQAKHFLAHPLVVQQLEAIWAGNIVFHSMADNLHRLPLSAQVDNPWPWFGSLINRIKGERSQTKAGNSDTGGTNRLSKGKTRQGVTLSQIIASRRSVTLYNPRDASLFKLSRLRVPRYRAALSTLSFAMLLLLYLAVIRRQHLEISTLEIVFWFWSAGFMLDEVVGFNEQGFSLYIMSFWNVFDLGILALLFCYSCLRVWSVILTDLEQKLAVAGQAYDVLACCAVLLLPRLFSVLDHVQYFSQLLIAFRMMAADLLAISLLIIVCCSGFFVAFTFAFNTTGETPGEIVYDLFQMLMGFTPTAWAMWDRYNYAGRFILVCFMFISHFLVVTILVTVLTNSFMAVVQNADEEHQFLFAVNTISMVKSDALFAYIAPTNTFAWIIAPLRFVMPFRQFVKFNRTVIKATHFPVLLCIYLYERFCLCRTSWAYVASDFFDEEEDQDAGANTTKNRNRVFSSNRLVREPSIATFRKDQALEEVFKKPYRYDDAQSTRSPNVFGLGIDLGRRSARNNTVNVDTWMETLPEENSSSLREFDQSNADSKLARRRNSRNTTGGTPIQNFHRTYGTMRNRTETTRSVASDPEDLYSVYGPSPGITRRRRIRPPRSVFSGISRPARHLSRRVDIEEDEDEQHQGDDEDEEGKEGRSELPDDDDDDDDDGQDDRKGGGSRGDLENFAKTDGDGKNNSKVVEVEAMRSSDVENNEGGLIHDVATSAPSHKNLTSARTSRTSTIANASRHSPRPMTPGKFIRKPQSLGSTELASKEESQKGKDAEIPATSQNNDGGGFASGSDGLGDETDDEGEVSGSPVTMRAPLFRNAGTASGGLAGFDKRNKTNTTNSSRSGPDGGGGSGSRSTYQAKGPSRSREDTVSMASQAWAEDGSTAATSPMRRPTFKRTQSHPSRHLGSTTPSELPVALDLASDLGDNKAIGGGLIGAVPASFATQMAYASGGLRRPPSMERNSSTQDLMSRLVLARMKTLEEGFQQVIKEVKDLKVRDERNARRDREREKRPDIDGFARPSHAPGLALGNTSPRAHPHLSQHQRLPASGGHKRHPSRRGKSAVAKGKENSS